MDLIERLHAAVKASGVPKKKIAHLAGMSASRLSRLLNGRLKRPSVPDVEAVLGAIGKRMEDLYAERSAVDVRQALRALTEFVDQHEAGRQAPAALTASRVRAKRRASRAVIAYPAAATPNVVLFEGAVLRKKVPPELWARGARGAARVVGDSMIDAGIRDGDVVYFARASSRRNARGKIVVMRVNASVYLKYYEDVNGQKVLLSANSRYPPMTLAPGDDVELYGIVLLPRKQQ
jgi:SOS-response transcriptional repressor LexA